MYERHGTIDVRHGTGLNWVRRMVLAMALVVVTLGMGSVLAVSVAGKFGEAALGMKTGSMHPAINPGDLVLVQQVDPKSVHVGDIITFRRPNDPSEIYTHRVYSVHYKGNGQVDFTTRGDSNSIPDAWTVSYQGPAMRVVHVVRHGGIVLALAQSRDARRMIAVSIFLIVLTLLWPVIVTPERKLAGASLSTARGVL